MKLKRDPVYVRELCRLLGDHFGPVRCPLTYEKPHELAVAVILSAQCTDQQVNRVTPELFRRYPDLESLAKAKITALENVIRSTGFYHNKARNIQGFARALISEHDGKIPKDMDALVKLPGIGRKTANVVLQELYSVATGVVVDTHVKRISKVLGLTNATDPVKIERDLMKHLPHEAWMDFSLYLIFLGRSFCTARKRDCPGCPLRTICPSSEAPAIKRARG